MSNASTLSGMYAGGIPHMHQNGAASRFQTIARILLIATLFAAPWAYGAVLPWSWGAMTAAAFLALILWALGCAQRGVLKIAWSPLYWPFLAFLLLAVVQFFAGLTIDRLATRESLLKIVADLVFFFLAGQLLNGQPENRGVLARLGLVVLLLAFALSVLALAQFFTSPHAIYWEVRPNVGWVFGPYVNHNHYGGLMEMLMPVSAGYILSRPSHSPSRLVLWVAVILALVSVWVSGSRGASAAVLVEGLLFGAILLWRRPQATGRRILPLAVGVVAVSIGIFAWMVETGRVSNRSWSIFTTDASSLEANFGERFQAGKTALRIIESHPVIGVGLGCFEYVFPQYATFATDMLWRHVHDDYLEVVAETGLPGGLVLVVALVLFFRLAFRRLRERLRHEEGWIQLGAAVGCVGLLVHSLVDFNLRIPANAAWFVACLAIAVHPRSSLESLRKVVRASDPGRSGGFLT
jgi:O-antigen ligase